MKYNIYDKTADDYITVVEDIELTEEEANRYRERGLIVLEIEEEQMGFIQEWMGVLKKSGTRQLITDNLNGANVHYSGGEWRIAGNLDVQGAFITEEAVTDILVEMMEENKG